MPFITTVISPFTSLSLKYSIISWTLLPICSSNFFVNSRNILISLSPPKDSLNSNNNLLIRCGDSNRIVVFSFLEISKRSFSLSLFFFGRKPSNVNLEDGNPLETSAVITAHGPGMQIIFNPLDLASFTRSSPGSHIPVSYTHLTLPTNPEV